MTEDVKKLLTYIEGADHEGVGRLIAEYAIGYKLRTDGTRPPSGQRTPMTWPTSVKEFADEVRNRQIGRVRDELVGLSMSQHSVIELHLRLPPKDVIEAAIDHFAGQPDTRYSLPEFYERMILDGRPWPNPEPMRHLNFWYCRLGDYTLSFCG